MNKSDTPERLRTRKKSSKSRSPMRSVSPNTNSQSAKAQKKQLLEFLNEQKEKDSLVVQSAFMNERGANDLAKFLHEHPHYSSVDISGNNISSENFGLICKELKLFQNLQVLKVDQNCIGEEPAGIRVLAEILSELPRLMVIDLRYNRIGKDCGQALAKLIEEGQNLQKLDLRWNDIGDEEAGWILEALRVNPRNIQVYLGGNRLEGPKICDEILHNINAVSRGLNVDLMTKVANRSKEISVTTKENYSVTRNRSKSSNSRSRTPNKDSGTHSSTVHKKYRKHNSFDRLIDLKRLPENNNQPHHHSSHYKHPKNASLSSAQANKYSTIFKGRSRSFSPLNSKNHNLGKVFKSNLDEKNLQKYMKTNKTVRKLKRMLDEERERSANLTKLMRDQIEKELLYERKSKIEIESRNITLESELRERDLRYSELQSSVKKITEDCSLLEVSNSKLREELSFGRTRRTDRMPVIEPVSKDQIKEELESMRREISHINASQADLQMKDITNQWQQESEKLEKQAEYLRNEVQKARLNYQEELKENEAQIRQKERLKYDQEIRKLEAIFSTYKREADSSQVEFESLKIKNQSLRSLNGNSKLQLSDSTSKNEERIKEIARLDYLIAKLEDELSRTYTATNQIDQTHRMELEALINEHKTARAKWNNSQIYFSQRIEELGRDMREARETAVKYDSKYKILVDSLQNNVNKAISTTFSGFETN